MRTKFFKAWGQKEIHQEGYRKCNINIKLHDIQSHYFEDYLQKDFMWWAHNAIYR